jgi:hypothetical protein
MKTKDGKHNNADTIGDMNMPESPNKGVEK